MSTSSGIVRKIVIPIAGKGTRMYPATKLIPKAFLTIIDPEDGLCKPAIVYTLEKLYKAFQNLKIADFEFILIISEEQQEFIHNYFNLTDQHEKIYSGKPELFTEFKLVRAVISKIKYVIQKEQKGFGHALLCAKQEIGNDPFLLLFGDHVIHSPKNVNPFESAILSAEKDLAAGFSTIFLQPTDAKEAAHYTLMKGDLLVDEKKLEHKRLVLNGHIFKPTNNIDSSFKIDNNILKLLINEEIKDENSFLRLFGLFFFAGNQEIFAALEKAFKTLENNKKGEELDITDGFHEMMTTKKLLGALISPKEVSSLDFGTPDRYAYTLKHLSQFAPQ